MSLSEDDTSRIKTALDAALASSSLNQWKRTFLTDMQARIEKYGTRTKLSPKQYAKLKQILAPFEASKPSSPQRSTASQPVPAATARQRTSPSAQQRPRPVSSNPSRPAPRRRSLSPSPMGVIRQTRRSLRDAMWIVIAIGSVFAFLGGLFDTSGPSSDPVVTSSPRSSQAEIYRARDFSITDGDTVKLYGARKGTRLVGFNTAETYRPQCDAELALGQQATVRLKGLVQSADQVELRLVRCACSPGTEGTENCNFGRSCGVLKIDGRDVGDILIAEGLAVRFQCDQTGCPRTPRPWCG